MIGSESIIWDLIIDNRDSSFQLSAFGFRLPKSDKNKQEFKAMTIKI